LLDNVVKACEDNEIGEGHNTQLLNLFHSAPGRQNGLPRRNVTLEGKCNS